MHIAGLYIYPIKSLRGIKLDNAKLTSYGFPYDRRFMLLRDHGEGSKHAEKSASRYENMTVAAYASMCLFQPAIVPCSTDEDNDQDEESACPGLPHCTNPELEITYTYPNSQSTSTTHIPLEPNVADLEPLPISLHNSPTTALRMPDHHSRWFSNLFGFDVVLVYLDPERRRPVMGNIAPNAAVRNRLYHERARERARLVQAEKEKQEKQSGALGWLGSIVSALPGTSAIFGDNSNAAAQSTTSKTDEDQEEHDKDPAYTLTFADCSPYLIISTASYSNVASRLPPGQTLDIEKFRPNIIIGGVDEAWDEDFWAELALVGRRQDADDDEEAKKDDEEKKADRDATATKLHLTANCIRCTSLNVDYPSGTFGTFPAGQVLKSLQSDRRVDAGKKFGPVMGRYGFLPHSSAGNDEGLDVRVGDRVVVSRRNERRTVWRWPGSGVTKKDDLYPEGDLFT